MEPNSSSESAHSHPGGSAGGRPGRPAMATPPEAPDINEKGRAEDGTVLTSDRRLYMQLLAFTGCQDSQGVAAVLERAEISGVVYEDLNDPRGIAVLTYSEDPAFFIDTLRPQLNHGVFANLEPRPEYTMFGRTYSLGYEPDLQEVLFDRPIRAALTPEWPWAIWYPLRRSGKFEKLEAKEQRQILMEHGTIGHAFGGANLAHDVRLACHGLDKNDSDFVIGITGDKLHPLSAVVQSMRKTTQTSLYLERLGPFFIGRAVWQKRFDA